MLEDYSAQLPKATWNSARGVWEKPMANLFCAHWALFQEVWPTSGMTVGGQLFVLPTLERHINEQEFSSSLTLRTPSVIDSTGGAKNADVAEAKGNHVKLQDQMATLALANGLKVSDSLLLPTPNTMEHREIKTPEQIADLKERSPGGYRNLREVIIHEIPNELLPTPTVGHAAFGNHDEDIDGYLQRRTDFENGLTKGMPGASLGVAVRMETLPTPTAVDYKGSAQSEVDADDPKHRLKVAVEVIAKNNLLPTPQVDDGKNTGHNQDRRVTLASEVYATEQATAWGKFEPAIRRWELVLGRQAPPPTNPDGKDDAHRLSSKFTEWMMGLPDGWITDAGLTRAQELKACGNGVVPQQAQMALRELLAGTEWINE
jgi:hypothetical protein